MDVAKDSQRNQDVAVQEVSDSASVAARTTSVATRCPIRTKLQTSGGVFSYVLAFDLGAECLAQQVTHV